MNSKLNKNNMYILVPTYNEESYIVGVYGRLSKQELKFFFVNDGSTDYTLYLLNHIRNEVGGFYYLSYYPNKGKGNAIKEGAKHLIQLENAEYMLIFDSDGQNRIEDIPNFLTALREHPDAKIIIGNRFHASAKMPLLRFVINKLMSYIISKMAHTKIADSQCGMRLVHKEVFSLITKEKRFAYESEQLIKAGRAKMKIISAPIKCIYDKNRVSKMNYILDTIRFFKMIKRLLTK